MSRVSLPRFPLRHQWYRGGHHMKGNGTSGYCGHGRDLPGPLKGCRDPHMSGRHLRDAQRSLHLDLVAMGLTSHLWTSSRAPTGPAGCGRCLELSYPTGLTEHCRVPGSGPAPPSASSSQQLGYTGGLLGQLCWPGLCVQVPLASVSTCT